MESIVIQNWNVPDGEQPWFPEKKDWVDYLKQWGLLFTEADNSNAGILIKAC
jgi:hypothetical protein